MSRFEDLCTTRETIKDGLEAVESELFTLFEDVVSCFNHFIDMKIVFVESFYQSGSWVYVTFGWSFRGCSKNEEVSIPLFILTSDDPVKEAKQYKNDVDKEKAKIDQEDRIRIIEELEEKVRKLREQQTKSI